MKLLSPFMPFVTEEIWHKLPGDEGSLMVSQFPSEDDNLNDEEAVKHMGVIMDVITRIRNIRGEMNIPPSKKLKVLLSVPDAELISIVTIGRHYIIDLAKLQELSIEGETKEEPKGVATGIAGTIKVYVFLEGMIDIAGEIARLEKEKSKLIKNLAMVSKKLANQEFRQKASEKVVEKEKLKSKELKEKSIILDSALSRLHILEG
jgi:valyl-tRNA synthetase